MKKRNRLIALLLMAAMLASLLAMPVLADEAAEEEIPTGNQAEGAWIYEVSQAAMVGPGGPGGGGGGMPMGDMGGGMGGDPNAMGGDPNAMGGDPNAMGGDPNAMGGDPNAMGGDPNAMGGDPNAAAGDPGMGGGGGSDPSQEELDAFMAMMMAGSDPEATLLWGDGEEKTGNVVMIPATLGGYPVTTIGNGAQTISSNNKNEDVYVLFPEGVTTFSPRMIYDYNSTSGWSIPSSVTSIADGTFLSCPGTFYGVAGSAAETYASTDATRDFVDYTADGSVTFTAEVGEEGYMQPNGTYYLPSGMLDGKHSVSVHIVANYQFKIASLTVDGAEVAEAKGENAYRMNYTFTTGSSGISVTFEADPEDDRDPAEMTETFDYEAPAIAEGAVAEGAELPADVNDYIGVNTGSTAKYNNTMGISTGYYYAADGKVYEQFKSYQSTEEPEYLSKAEAINGIFEKDGLVYGKDYDHLRLYNYYENVTNGPAQGVVQLYCTYLYKEIDASDIASENTVTNDNINTASVFVQQGGDLTLDGFTSYCYTTGKGPSEAGNFFGMGSAIHVDGGDATTPATTIINKATSTLTLNDPKVLGTVNSIYATASGVIYIEGGDIFSCSSGGHGPYVSTAGQILLNVDGTNLVAEDGTVNRVAENLAATKRPAADLGTMSRNADGDMEGVYQPHDGNVTVVVTGDEAGTALATDSGGGVIVANNVVTKTFGLRCAGVYSIGSNESWVYCYNSSLTSYLDAGLCSASGGYIYAYNCDINGVMGIKTRAGGNAQAEETGVYVTNSRVAAYYDDAEMKGAYDVADPADMQAKMDSGEIDVNNITTGYSDLNMFLDKANTPKFYEESLDWWFTDKSKTPGYSGGNKFAVIYVENSSTPIYVEASKMVNQNFVEYGDPSKLEEGQTPADNLLLSVEGAGSATVNFKDENSKTLWDLTGESTDTTELVGDFFIGAYSQASGSPDKGTGPNSATVNFENSEWEGTVLYGDTEEITGICNLNFDQNSAWKVTGDTKVANLEIYNVENITADEPVTITFDSTTTVVAGTYGNVTLEGPGVDAWPEIVVEEEPVEEAPVEETPAEEAPAEVPVEEPAEVPAEEPVEAPAEETPAEGGISGGIIAAIVVVIVAVAAVVIVIAKKKKKD